MEGVMTGFVRVVTHPKVFHTPSPTSKALDFIESLSQLPQCVILHPGPRQWEIFRSLCVETGARGNLIPDAYLAALAIERDCVWYSEDADFGRFGGLRWKRPLS